MHFGENIAGSFDSCTCPYLWSHGEQREREKERNKIAPKESRDRSGEARRGEARREIDSYRSISRRRKRYSNFVYIR